MMTNPPRFHRSLLAGIFASLLPLLLIGCGDGGDARAPDAEGATAAGGAYDVVTTVGMITDVVQAVAGERARVTGIIGQGIDPHLYKPTRNDVSLIMNGDVIFYVGLLLEGKMADTLERVGESNPNVIAVTERLEEQYLLKLPSGHFDPHVWMDVKAWSAAVDVVATRLKSIYPEDAAAYDERAAAYQAQLAALDAYVRRVIASIPEQQRVLITAHDAFNYFGRAYGIDVRGIQGISTESEAGLDDINRLVDFIVERGIAAVFVESSVSDKNVRALIEGAASRGHQVRIGGELYSDAMGQAGTYEGTYIGMIDHNATVIARALGGEAPEAGLHGKLQHRE